VGEWLLQHVISEAQALELNTLFLLTNAKCEAAVHLYEKMVLCTVKRLCIYIVKAMNVAMRYGIAGRKR
jgi:ribosomal protein S18 acetylase RimI-like enzyme